MLYPEGGTSNGRHLLPFKKGGFAGMKAVIPIILIYDYENFSPAYDIIPFPALLIMQMSLCYWRLHVKILPPFKPNEYLLS